MANYCFTKYAIEGKKEILEKVADAINRADGMMLKSIKNLGLKVGKNDYEDAGRAEWYRNARVEDRDGVGVLFFTQAYPWCHTDVIDDVLRQLGEPNPKIYLLMEIFESDFHQTNDSEGMYFPGRYMVWTEEDDDDVYFVTKDEALAHIRQQYKLSDDYDTIEMILAYCEEHDLELCFNEIEVIE
ncbi:MAG: hypothetical protein MJZ76_06735 [Bacteroidales bacterium]|nr:hypothetical protein [Bacteroidales bacterium]